MKLIFSLLVAAVGSASLTCSAEDITTLDGHKFENVRSVALKANGLFFVCGSELSLHGVTVPFTNLTAEVKEKYHYDPYEVWYAYARQNREVPLSKQMAFSLNNLEAAKKKAKAEKKMLGFVMVWDQFFKPAQPMDTGSDSGLAHFYDVFHDNLMLVFVRHESELGSVPDSVKQGFNGPEEGGFAPNMAVVTADCSRFVCEIPYGGKGSNGQIREAIFRQKVEVIKKFAKEHGDSK